MQVEAVPLTSFVHGHINADEGRPMLMEEGLARDLERAGLVRVKLIARRVDQALSVRGAAAIVAEAGKAPDDGKVPPSSASPVDQALAMGKSLLSKPGAGKHRKSGA